MEAPTAATPSAANRTSLGTRNIKDGILLSPQQSVVCVPSKNSSEINPRSKGRYQVAAIERAVNRARDLLKEREIGQDGVVVEFFSLSPPLSIVASNKSAIDKVHW